MLPKIRKATSCFLALLGIGTTEFHVPRLASSIKSTTYDLENQLLKSLKLGDQMGIKRPETDAVIHKSVSKALKPICDFDDSSIRKMLRSAYEDFVGRELESYMNPLVGLTIHDGIQADVNRWTKLERFSNQADLKLFWDMFVQKQVFIFEQESTLLMNLEKQDW
jgi:hypothetical protein